ncbi:MAG: anti-sigma factor family protein, partial [Phycisphaerae bacterium]
MPAKPSKEQLEELLSAYIDGECSNADRARLERAMAADPDLRSRLDQLRQTVRLVQSIEGEPAPEHLRQRILAQLERRSLLGDLPGRAVAPTPSRLLPRAGLAAAIFVLAVGAGWWIYRASTGRLRSMPGPSRQFAAVKPAEPETTSMPPFQEAGQLAAAKPGQPGPTRGAEPVAAPGPAPKTDQQKPLPPVDALAMARGAKREAR